MALIDVDSDNWKKEVLEAKSLVLVDFWHERCPWCRRLDPIYAEVAGEYGDKVKFAKLNVFSSQENSQLAVANGVMGTPTLIFYCQGRQIGTLVGFQQKDQLKKAIDDMLARQKLCIQQSTELKPN